MTEICSNSGIYSTHFLYKSIRFRNFCHYLETRQNEADRTFDFTKKTPPRSIVTWSVSDFGVLSHSRLLSLFTVLAGMTRFSHKPKRVVMFCSAASKVENERRIRRKVNENERRLHTRNNRGVPCNLIVRGRCSVRLLFKKKKPMPRLISINVNPSINMNIDQCQSATQCAQWIQRKMLARDEADLSAKSCFSEWWRNTDTEPHSIED